QPAPQPLSPARLREFAGWEHVVAVEPELREPARLVFRGQVRDGTVSGFEAAADRLDAVVEFGRPPEAGADELIAHEFLLYQWGVRSDAEVRAALGRTVRVEFAGTEAMRPAALLFLLDADPSKMS